MPLLSALQYRLVESRPTHDLISKHFVRESEASDLPKNASGGIENSTSPLSGDEAREFYLSLFDDQRTQLGSQNASSWTQSSCSRNCDPMSRSHVSSLHHQVSVLFNEPIRPSPLLIPPSNRGYKILRHLGWTDFAVMDISVGSVDAGSIDAGGLGRRGQGRRLPIATVLKRDRLGLGATVKNRPRITHFAPNDVKAVDSESPPLRKKCPLRINKRLQVNRNKADRLKEIRFRHEFYFDDDQLQILYNEITHPL
ncbi:unnamed protein product [Hydatigera taeniaeformis]|uniref:G-patch domain-containing protein n=1 Tax=Hydatigena taeniaeformis TaxID=6205 RepID=A0A0R3WZP8_HYDTA|nr:unnamed protein product [Hydatigera taeniaeformis]